jgi:hypothetical protein
VASLVALILGQPILRAFALELCVRLFSELLAGPKSDPEFQSQFLALSNQLGSATTEEEKRAALKKLKALRHSRT